MHPNMRNFTAPYVYAEYPKWVTKANGEQVIIDSAEAEASALGEDIEMAGDEREALLEKARSLGLNPHHRIGIEKLKTLIEKESQS